MFTWELCQKRKSFHSFILAKVLHLGDALKGHHGLLLAILLPFIPIAAYWAPINGTDAAIKAESQEFVWVAESDGLLAVNSADGTTGMEITQAAGAQVAAVDGNQQVIWTYAQSTLSAFAFDGQALASIPVAPPAGANNGAPAAALAVVPSDGSVWFALHKTLFHYDAQGGPISTAPINDQIQSLAIDEKNNRLWVATAKTLASVDATVGTPGLTLDLGKNPVIKDIACDFQSSALWVVLSDKVVCYD